jgi:coenzyme F420-reducing hydrogenase gamma subunit
MKKNKKPKIAIINLTSCSGCLIEIVNLGKRFLDILKYIEIVDFPLVEEARSPAKYDIAFVEGSAVTKENIEDLRIIRKKTKFLVALGACACIGGIPEIKNYRGKDKIIKSVYRVIKKIDNPEIKPLKEYVKVDFEIPGCPPNKNEFYWAVTELLAGKLPRIPRRPVCYECQIRGYECLLQKGLPCLGPVTLGGCEAICLRENWPCAGCRGFLPNV